MSSAMDEESDEDIWITQETFRVNPSENLACDPEFISILNDLKKPPVLDEEKEPYDLVNNAKFVRHLPVERVSDIDLLERVKERVPKGTVNNTKWCVTVWEDWKEKRNAECMSSTNDEFVVVPENMVAMRTTELNYWLAKFMMEVRRKTDCQPYHGITTQSSRYPLFFLGMYLTKKPSTLSKLGVAFEFSQGKSGLIKE